MANLSRIIAFVLFTGTFFISGALFLHGTEWGDERIQVLQDLRGAMSAAGLIAFALFLIIGKKPTRTSRERAVD